MGDIIKNLDHPNALHPGACKSRALGPSNIRRLQQTATAHLMWNTLPHQSQHLPLPFVLGYLSKAESSIEMTCDL